MKHQLAWLGCVALLACGSTDDEPSGPGVGGSSGSGGSAGAAASGGGGASGGGSGGASGGAAGSAGATGGAAGSGAAAGSGGTAGTGATAGSGGTAGSGSFLPPNLVPNASFETDWDGLVNWSLSGPPTGVTRDNTTASHGSYSLLRTWVPSQTNTGAQATHTFAAQDRIWVRFYFRLTANISSFWKWSRTYSDKHIESFGGLFVRSGDEIIAWSFDQESSAVTNSIGLTEAMVLDGKWHSLEYDYWRNGDPSGEPSVAFWFDGKPISGVNPTKWFGNPNKAYWANGRLHAGERKSSAKISLIDWLSTLNSATNSGQCNLDWIGVSNLGPIGP